MLSISVEENPDFYNANHVFVPYCSSDLWSGNRPASFATGGWRFRGYRIVRSVITDLKNVSITAEPNLADAKEVLFSGSSAGGGGVLANLDRVAYRLPNTVVRGVDDAGWVVDMDPFDPSLDPPTELAQGAQQFWHGRVDAGCAAANPFNKGLCYLEFAYPYIKTPLFIQMSQYDTALSKRLGLTLPFDTEEEKYADQLAKEMRKSLGDVESAFSPATRTHSLLANDSFGVLSIEGYTLREVLGNWFFNRSGPTKLIEK